MCHLFISQKGRYKTIKTILRLSMKKILLIIIASILLTSCNYYWVHPDNLPESAFRRDAFECDRYAQQDKYRAADALRGNPYAGPVMIAAYDKTFDNCMHSKGYEKRYKTNERNGQ